MSAPFTFLNFAMEDVVATYIRANDNPAPCNIYVTAEAIASGATMAEPFIAISCDASGPVPGMDIDASSGCQNQTLTVSLAVRTHAANEDLLSNGIEIPGRQYHAETVGRVMDLLYAQTLVQNLNDVGIPNIGIVQVDTPTTSMQPADRSYVTVIRFNVHAYPKDG